MKVETSLQDHCDRCWNSSADLRQRYGGDKAAYVEFITAGTKRMAAQARLADEVHAQCQVEWNSGRRVSLERQFSHLNAYYQYDIERRFAEFNSSSAEYV